MEIFQTVIHCGSLRGIEVQLLLMIHLRFVVESAGNPWELQAYQSLSAEQIAALAQGGDWELTFDAMSPDGAKSFHVFLGEVGGGWARYWEGNIDVDGTMKTYTQYQYFEQKP